MELLLAAVAAVCLSFPSEAARAANPITNLEFSADPSAHVFNGRLYVYPSHDRNDARKIVLGIRPEDIELNVPASIPVGVTFVTFQAVVDIVEMMGAETNLYLQTGSHLVICRSQAVVEQHEIGHRLQFRLNAARAHLFDPLTTERIV